MDNLHPLEPPNLPLSMRLRTLLPQFAQSTKLDEEIEEFVRKAICAQLQRRVAFPLTEWEATDIGPAVAEPACQLIAHVFEWPNHYFLPQDREVILIRGWCERNVDPLWTAIDDRFYSPGGLHEFVGDPESLTLAEFIRAVLPATEKH